MDVACGDDDTEVQLHEGVMEDDGAGETTAAVARAP